MINQLGRNSSGKESFQCNIKDVKMAQKLRITVDLHKGKKVKMGDLETKHCRKEIRIIPVLHLHFNVISQFLIYWIK